MKDDRLLELRVFEAVVHAGGFTNAAHGLGVSQPFVSQTIKRLETRLGTQLLHRTTRGQRLTSEGETFLDKARHAIAAVDAIDASVLNDHTQIAGVLRVTAPIAFGLDRVTPLMPDFMRAFPQLELDLRLTDDIENLLEAGVDVAVRMGRMPDSGLLSRRLCSLQRLVVAAPKLLEKYGTPRVPADLANLPCLAWDGNRAHLNRWDFSVDGEIRTFRVTSRFRSNQGMTLYQMCLAGQGVMRMAEHLARPEIQSGRLVELLPEFNSDDDTTIQLVFLPNREIVPRVRGFVDFMTAAFKVPVSWDHKGAGMFS